MAGYDQPIKKPWVLTLVIGFSLALAILFALDMYYSRQEKERELEAAKQVGDRWVAQQEAWEKARKELRVVENKIKSKNAVKKSIQSTIDSESSSRSERIIAERELVKILEELDALKKTERVLHERVYRGEIPYVDMR